MRVSIIVPAYNAGFTIGPAIESALRQTEQSLELIVIDDGSGDATADVARQFANRDHRVRVFSQDGNRGPAAARNRGILEARGEWIAPLDADDEFLPERIEKLIALANRHGADVVSDNPLLCEAQGSAGGLPMIAPGSIPTARPISAADFVAGNVGSRYAPRVSYGFMKPVIRRSFIDLNSLRYDERNRFGEDFLFSLDCLLRGARWWFTPEPMYRYTVRSGTLTEVQSAGDLLRIRTREEDLLRNHAMAAADPALAAALRRHKAVIEHFYYYRAFTDALKAGSIAPALHFLFESQSSFRHILTESAMQGPRVVLKALRGGYRPARTVAASRDEPAPEYEIAGSGSARPMRDTPR